MLLLCIELYRTYYEERFSALIRKARRQLFHPPPVHFFPLAFLWPCLYCLTLALND